MFVEAGTTARLMGDACQFKEHNPPRGDRPVDDVGPETFATPAGRRSGRPSVT
jgi:hypothetical protein